MSPSPFTIIYWLILIAWTYPKLYITGKYKRLPRLMSLTDSACLVGFVVLTNDLIWVTICGLRFGYIYPDSVLQLVICAFRDIAGALLCYSLAGQHWTRKTVSITKKTRLFYMLNIVFITVWFLLATSPAWTDWTYAIKYDYPISVIATSFLTSHIIGKSITTLIYYTLFPKI